MQVWQVGQEQPATGQSFCGMPCNCALCVALRLRPGFAVVQIVVHAVASAIAKAYSANPKCIDPCRYLCVKAVPVRNVISPTSLCALILPAACQQQLAGCSQSDGEASHACPNPQKTNLTLSNKMQSVEHGRDCQALAPQPNVQQGGYWYCCQTGQPGKGYH